MVVFKFSHSKGRFRLIRKHSPRLQLKPAPQQTCLRRSAPAHLGAPHKALEITLYFFFIFFFLSQTRKQNIVILPTPPDRGRAASVVCPRPTSLPRRMERGEGSSLGEPDGENEKISGGGGKHKT